VLSAPDSQTARSFTALASTLMQAHRPLAV
jgi:hypothetical protein